MHPPLSSSLHDAHRPACPSSVPDANVWARGVGGKNCLARSTNPVTRGAPSSLPEGRSRKRFLLLRGDGGTMAPLGSARGTVRAPPGRGRFCFSHAETSCAPMGGGEVSREKGGKGLTLLWRARDAREEGRFKRCRLSSWQWLPGGLRLWV